MVEAPQEMPTIRLQPNEMEAHQRGAREVETAGVFLRQQLFQRAALLGVAVFGGMFVVPLYAFLTTTVDKSQTARTVAANNIVNSGAMVIGSAMAFALSSFGVGPVGQLLLVAAMCLVAAWLGWKLHLACD